MGDLDGQQLLVIEGSHLHSEDVDIDSLLKDHVQNNQQPTTINTSTHINTHQHTATQTNTHQHNNDTTTITRTTTTTTQQQHRRLSQACPLLRVTCCEIDLSWQQVTGAAQRQKQRRLRSWWRPWPRPSTTQLHGDR